jgi:hypothetical protein
MFAIFCAEQVANLVRKQDKETYQEAINTAKRWLIGEASREECDAAANAAYAAWCLILNVSAWAAGHAVASAGAAAASASIYSAQAARDAAAHAASAADAADTHIPLFRGVSKDKLIKRQWNYYNDLLSLDTNLENIFTGERDERQSS